MIIDADTSLPVLTTVGGHLIIDADTSLPVLRSAHGVPGHLLAVSEYGLWAGDDGLYYAGCRRALTREQALAHWARDVDRAMLFTLAILMT